MKTLRHSSIHSAILVYGDKPWPIVDLAFSNARPGYLVLAFVPKADNVFIVNDSLIKIGDLGVSQSIGRSEQDRSVVVLTRGCLGYQHDCARNTSRKVSIGTAL